MSQDNERIRSLEIFLGVKYIPAETKDDFSEHVVDADNSWSLMNRLQRLLNWAKTLGEKGISNFDFRD